MTTEQDQGKTQLRSILSDLTALDGGDPMVGPHRSAILHCVRKLVPVIESISPRHQGHGQRTADLAHRLGRAAGRPPAELIDLTLAGLLHDIGLVTLPPALLNETQELLAQEFASYQSHPRAGAELLQSISFLRRPAIWIAHHHERWDGCGYPYGLRGRFIPQGARILAVADTFDTFLHPPSGPHSHVSTAVALLQVIAGTQLDPELVGSCVEILSCPTVTEGVDATPV